MAYARRHKMGASRTFAIAVVALTQASLGYALVSGLAYTAIQEPPDGLKTFNVETEQPPPPRDPLPRPKPARKKLPESQPRVIEPAPVDQAKATMPPVSPPLLEVATAPEPAPQPAFSPTQLAPSPDPVEKTAQSATGDLQRLFQSQDYPRRALEDKEQGSVTVQLTVGVTGRVGACDITSSSGSRTLDNASCRILRSRAIFTPARDSSGHLTTDTVQQEIRWVLR